MKVALYYLKDEGSNNEKANKKTATIALMQRGGECSRGIAICSSQDQFKFRGYLSGRHLALNRALKALNKERRSGEINRPDAQHLMERVGWELTKKYKVDYMPDLTDFEKKLLQEAKTFQDMGFDTIEDYIDDLTFEMS